MEKIFKVSEFNEFINVYLNQVGEITVEGEISQINISQGKWLFMTIKDESSSVEVFGILNTLPNYNLLEEGMLVHIYGVPRLYQKTGRFSISATQIMLAGEGSLKIAFEKLKSSLEKEGLFEESRKRVLPMFPQKIGLITAKNSQAYYDFIKVLKARMGGIKIYFYPVSVQGRESANSITGAFDYFNSNFKDLDAVILTRGGGSLEDLQSFNTEEVARAIFSSKFPVVCGVGHEKDVSIADMVCDLRASTPSNSAELIAEQKEYVLSKITANFNYLYNTLNNLKEEKKHNVQKNIMLLESSLITKAEKIRAKMKDFRFQFEKFGMSVEYKISQVDENLRLLRSLDYKNVLRRGFSITYNQEGNILKRVGDALPNSTITTELLDGRIISEILKETPLKKVSP
ncbi:exodeoxyribonuclease VII large subunit [Patescibacteria group bacterium]|nr:exodeoxyribonuclease VII large subunit [Patescibacteria group bacterium]